MTKRSVTEKEKPLRLKEIVGDLWDYYNKPGFAICILTNGDIQNGKAIMGKGCALECKRRLPKFPEFLACELMMYGNIACLTPYGTDTAFPECRVLTFPTKHHYWDKADLSLIKRSANQLKRYARAIPDTVFILPRPGCGNGGLHWTSVRRCLLEVSLPDNVWIISRKEDK